LFDRDKCYVSIDIETTGLNHYTDQILEIAAVIDDNEGDLYLKPAIRIWIKRERLYGNPTAIVMNADLLRQINEREFTPLTFVEEAIDLGSAEVALVVHPHDAGRVLNNFLVRHIGHEKVTVAGKNFGGFDRQFLEKLDDFPEDRFRHRYLDPGNLWWDPTEDNFVLPDSDTVKKRCGGTSGTTHQALDDAYDTCEAVRQYLRY
jgi:oligoribonuclease (3'-5' exoribonuclease)